MNFCCKIIKFSSFFIYIMLIFAPISYGFHSTKTNYGFRTYMIPVADNLKKPKTIK